MATQENLNKFKIGQCHNVGNCTHIGEKQAIPSEIANSGGFKCKYCGAQLQEVEKPKSFWEKYGKVIMIASIVLVLAGIGYVIYTLTSGNSENDKAPSQSEKIDEQGVKEPKVEEQKMIPGSQGGNIITQLTITDTKDISLKKGATKQLNYQAVPEQNSEIPTWESTDPAVASVDADGLVTAMKKGSVKITVKTQNVVSDPLTVTVTEDALPPQPLPYGRYTGDRNAQGQPHGFGEVVFTKSKLVTGNTYAEPGYKIRNARFVNGKLQSGTLYDKDGIKVCFIDANNNL